MPVRFILAGIEGRRALLSILVGWLFRATEVSIKLVQPLRAC